MAWTCEQIEERLSDSLDELLTPVERADFDAHLLACSRCAPLVAQVSGVVIRLHRMEPPIPPPELIPRILDATVGPPKARRNWLRWLTAVWQPRYALGFATVIATLLILQGSLHGHTGRTLLATINPLNIYRSADRNAHLVYARGVKFVNDLRLVYAIQSRLQPESPPPPPPQPSTNPGQSGEQKKPAGQVNRAIPPRSNPQALAFLLAGVPQRSLR